MVHLNWYFGAKIWLLVLAHRWRQIVFFKLFSPKHSRFPHLICVLWHIVFFIQNMYFKLIISLYDGQGGCLSNHLTDCYFCGGYRLSKGWNSKPTFTYNVPFSLSQYNKYDPLISSQSKTYGVKTFSPQYSICFSDRMNATAFEPRKSNSPELDTNRPPSSRFVVAASSFFKSTVPP